jgi:hypothetical protein
LVADSRAVDRERQCPARPLHVGQEMALGLLGHPPRKAHGVDHLDGTGDEGGRVGNTLAALVSVPTEGGDRPA